MKKFNFKVLVLGFAVFGVLAASQWVNAGCEDVADAKEKGDVPAASSSTTPAPAPDTKTDEAK